MAVTTREGLMEVGSVEIELANTPVIRDWLIDEDNYNRPYKHYILIYDALSGGNLVCPPMMLLRVQPTETGISIGGSGPLSGLDRTWFSIERIGR